MLLVLKYLLKGGRIVHLRRKITNKFNVRYGDVFM